MHASEILLDPLVQTFNQLLSKDIPPAWCTGLFHLIFKAGDPENAGNYRGITTVAILAELYAMVLETRAAGRAEHCQCRAKRQLGRLSKGTSSDGPDLRLFIIQASFGETGQALVRQAKQQKR